MKSSTRKGITKKVQVKLTSCHIPLKRKFILIKEGKQLLMLKALGDSRCVYSIEERGIARRGITRSGKRHFQFSLPKFVNALEGMNNHNQHPNDHMTSKFPHPSTGASHNSYKSRKGHFAKKSTGNNIRHGAQMKSSAETKKQISSQDAQKTAKPVRSHSAANTSPVDSAHKHSKSSSQAENLKILHQKLKGEHQKDLKGPNVSTRASKQKQSPADDTPLIKGDSQKEQQGDQQRGVHRSHSPASKTETSGEQYAHHVKEKTVKSLQLDDKENVKECENYSKDDENCSPNKSVLLNGSKTKAGRELENNEKFNVAESDKTVSLSSKEPDQDHVNSLEKCTGKLETKIKNASLNSYLDLELQSRQLPETLKKIEKRERALTPTPESPAGKSIVNKLSRKRHRSASPKVCSSKVESNTDLSIKPHKEPIRLHTKNYEKVKNAFKNVISQRKDKTTSKTDVESVLNVSAESECSKTSSGCSVPDQSGSPNGEDKQEPLSDDYEPFSKKPKLSLTGNVKTNISQRETAKSPVDTSKTPSSHPHTDSDDGLARLMKDFQSAIVAGTTPKNSNGTTQTLKYISKKTSQHFLSAKSNKLPLDVQRGRREETKTTKLCKPSQKFQKLQPIPTEDVSSDEECEHSDADVDTKMPASTLSKGTKGHTVEDSQNFQTGKHCTTETRPRVKIQNSISVSTPSPDKFMVVDEIGFPTAEDSSDNSLQSTCNISESQKTSSPNTPDHISLPHSKGEKEQLPEEEFTLKKGQTCSSATDKAQELDKTAFETNNKSTVSVRIANGNVPNCGNLKGGEMTQDSLQDGGQRKDSHCSLKREYENVTRDGDGKRTKISYEQQSVKVQSHYTQTDEIVISRKDKAIATEGSSKSNVKNQATQFDGEPKDIDTEEISRIVAAMYESECEEKERLVKALQVQKERETKWRTLVQDYARQLQELKDQLDGKKRKDTTVKGINTGEESSSASLPVIISSQGTQTERIQTKTTPVVIPSEEKAGPSTSAVKNNLSEGKNDYPENKLTSAATPDKIDSIIPSATKANAADERRLPTGPSTAPKTPPQVSKPTIPVQNVCKTQPSLRSTPNGNINIPSNSPAKSVQQNGIVQPASSDKNTKAEASRDVTIIDLTDTEDLHTLGIMNSTLPKRMAVQSRPSMPPGKTVQSSPINLRKSPGIPSKPNILQLTSKAGTKEQSLESKVKTLTSASLLTRPQMGTASDKTSVIPKRSQPPSSVQGIQRILPTNPAQNMSTVKVPSNVPVNQLVTIGQPIVTVPPSRLQAAPSIAGNIYSTQSTQVPVFSAIGNIGMIIGNQPQPRQEGAITGVLQTQGLLQRGLVTQTSPDILNQKSLLEKRQQELQQQLTQCYQRSNNQKITEISLQLQAVMTDLRSINERLNSQVQGQRNIRIAQVSAPSNLTTQASRLPLAPAYNIVAGTVPPVSSVHQLNPTVPQRDASSVKPYVPLSTPNTTLANASTKTAGKTWFPETRQGAENIDKQGKTNKLIQHFSQPGRPHAHPAKLPVLQQPPVSNSNPLLPPPSIRITHSPEGVVLSWNINLSQDQPTVKKYFLYAYQVLNTPPSTSHWKRIGEVGALAPPMACTLNQFQPGSTYFLAICAVDVYDRPGMFSKTEEVVIPT